MVFTRFLISVFVFAILSESLNGKPITNEREELWKAFNLHFNKSSSYSKLEEERRQKVFFDNVDYIAQHNMLADLGQRTFRLGINQHADMTLEEYQRFLIANKQRKNSSNVSSGTEKKFQNVKLESTVDWRSRGIVTPVKNQGQCGSCWAFSAVGAMEAAHAKATGSLVRLSEQYLVDCSRRNYGCNGGWMSDAFQDVIDAGGIPTEASYPYTGYDWYCSKRGQVGATIRSYSVISPGDEYSLKAAVATVGPISVAINAGTRAFQFYRSGVFNDPSCSNALNHGVLVVGYGTSNFGEDYWIVKNSWSTNWGDNGYILMKRNINQCGIADNAAYPIV